jgi:orotidine-5'-phosphate decarboxylase
MADPKEKLIVALDVPTFQEAVVLVEKTGDAIQIYKVGYQLFTAYGPMIVRYLMAQGKDVFLDLKFHDIPNTVANGVRSIVSLGVPVHDFLDEKDQKQDVKGTVILATLHVQGGEEMLKRAVDAAKNEAQNRGIEALKLVGITVLTSEQKEANVLDLVLERAALAKQAGLDGVVASSQETALLRREFGDSFIIVTPGIRPVGMDAQDQKRVATPREAITAGSSFLVVGRPIVQADEPKEAALKILKEIEEAL